MAPPASVDEVRRYVTNEIRRYVTNEIPIHLIDVHTLKLVDRGFARRYFEKEIDSITNDTSAINRVVRRHWKIKEAVKKTVTYAILSHRWLDEGEPTLKEMTEREPQSLHGPGYEKLKKFCEEAKRRGFRFAWSDTCCIDKTSSVELDESIRSMFRWYQNSGLCIVHLAQTTSLDNLKRDEWWKRGWTLQELLAPEKAKFFNKTWEPLTADSNDKEGLSLRSVIAQATGIPADDICGFTPGPRRVDQRMTWAAERETTRGEDVAYSLMGIFDVSMQIAYGEGPERAFHRLIEAIMLKGGDPTVLNFNTGGLHNDALPVSPADYVGLPWLGDYVSTPLDMALTGRGLRVPLIILPLELIDEKHLEGRDSNWMILQLQCPHYGIADISAFASRYNFSRSLSRKKYEFAWGIFHYSLMDHKHPVINPAGYLLYRRKGEEQHAANGSFDGFVDLPQDKVHASKWTRLRTKAHVAVVLHPELRPGEFRYVDRRHLETVYL